VRVPCIINWPGKITPKSIPEIVGHIDMLPTLVSLCNLDPPETLPLDGFDISQLLLEADAGINERLFFTKKSTESIIPDGAARSDQFRFVIENGDTMLFDMVTDPGEKRDISSIEIELTRSFAKAYSEWFQDVTSEFVPDTEIRIGFDGETKAYLPAHEAGFSGDIQFMEGHGWAHDWLVNWQNKSDSIYWEVVVDQPTSFNVELRYSCPVENVGSELSISCGDSENKVVMKQAHNPDYKPSPDRIQRIEVYEKEWAQLDLGEIHLEEGIQQIVLRAINIKNENVGEIKGLILTKLPLK